LGGRRRGKKTDGRREGRNPNRQRSLANSGREEGKFFGTLRAKNLLVGELVSERIRRGPYQIVQ